MVLSLVENLISKFQYIENMEVTQSNYFVVTQLQGHRSSKRSYLDVYKVLWAIFFNFCFKEDKGIAALPREEPKTQKAQMEDPPL